MNDNKIKIQLKGEDGYKVISVRIREGTIQMLDTIANESNQSRNQLINIFLEYGVKNYEIIE